MSFDRLIKFGHLNKIFLKETDLTKLTNEEIVVYTNGPISVLHSDFKSGVLR